MIFNRKYLCGSFLFHIIVFVLLYSVSLDNKVNKYTVLGVHSRKHTEVSYKDLRQASKQLEKNYSNRILDNQKQAAEKRRVANKKRAAKKKPKKRDPKKTKKKAAKKQIPKKKEVSKKKPEIKKQDKKPVKSVQVKPVVEKKQPVKKQKENKEKHSLPVHPVCPTKSCPEIERSGELSRREVVEEEEVLIFDLIYNSDPKFQEYHKSIQKTVNKLWRPPIGIAKGTEATVEFTFDKAGKIKSFDIIKRPKHFLYQSSITKVAKKFEFEKFFWGKKIIIVFRQ